MAAGAQRPAGPAPCAHEPPRKLLQPRPGPPAGPQPARPPASRPSAQQLLGPAPFLRPPPPPPPGTAPGRSPLPIRGRRSARRALRGPASRALNPLAAGDAPGAGLARAVPGPRGLGPLPVPRPIASSGLRVGRLPRRPSRPRATQTPDRPCPDRKWARVSHFSAPAPSSAGREGPGRPRAGPDGQNLPGLQAVALRR